MVLPRPSRLQFAVLGAGVAAALGLFLSWLFFDAWVARILRDAFSGASGGLLSDLIAAHRRGNPDVRTLAYFLETGRAFLGRLTALSIGGLVGLAALLRRPRPLLTRFFQVEGHPFNLAFFRVVLFLGLLLLFDEDAVTLFGGLPEVLRTSPPGMGFLFTHVPISEAWAAGAFRLFQLSCLSAMVGFRVRTSALLVVVFGVYALGIPQLYGKINHYHHLLWFAAILAASPCGDSFSVDALLRRRRQATAGRLILPKPARAYALPLRCIWLLLGLIYFFPGLWKFALCGPEWALSDNLKYVMYAQWFAHGGYVPAFRLDHYPLLYQGAALATLAFELSFIFLIYSPRLRPFAVLTGLAFHNLAGAFLRIFFFDLQLCYVAFANWHAFFLRAGRRVYRTPARFRYDGGRPAQRRLVATLSVLDIFGSVEPVDVHEVSDGSGTCPEMAPAPDASSPVIDGAARMDVRLYARLLRRVPLLVLALPLLLLDSLPYRHRTGDVRGRATMRWQSMRAPSARPTLAVAGLLLVGNVFCGFAGLHSWPLSVYPTFAGFAKPEASTIEIIARDASGDVIAWDADVMRMTLSPSRLNGLFRQVLRAEDNVQRHARLQALWNVAENLAPRLGQARSVALYEAVRSTLPEHYGRLPRSRTLLLQMNLSPSAARSANAGKARPSALPSSPSGTAEPPWPRSRTAPRSAPVLRTTAVAPAAPHPDVRG